MRKHTAGGLLFMAIGCAIAADAPETRDDEAWKLPEDATTWKLPALEPPAISSTPLWSAASPRESKPVTSQVLPPGKPALAELLNGTCYFIRQLNPDLRTPSTTPEFIPLASAPGQPSYYAGPNCLTASLIRGPIER